MKLDVFLASHEVAECSLESERPVLASAIAITGGMGGQTEHHIVIEHYGTFYEINKDDVLDIDVAPSPVVTKTGTGSPVIIHIPADAELSVRTSIISASDFDAHRPFSLKRPSRTANIIIPPASESELVWLAQRTKTAS